MKAIIVIACLVALLIALCSGTSFSAEYSVGAHYYPWYGDNAFHGNPPGIYSAIRWYLSPAQQPALGWYNDHDPSVVSSHLLWARGAGIDFFVATYWGHDNYIAWTIKNCLLSNPDIGNLKICVMLDGAPATGPITKDNVGDEITWLCNNLFADPGYYRINNKPVVMAYNLITISDADEATYCTNIRNAAAACGYQVFIVGDEAYGVLPRPQKGTAPNIYQYPSSTARCANFDAVMTYNQYSIIRPSYGYYDQQSNVNSWDTNNGAWKTLANSALAPTGQPVAYVPGVEPGYNDSEIRGNYHRPLSRKLGSDSGAEGSLFSAQLDKAKNRCSDINMILVSTFNEWHEDTQIEPCVPAGAVTSLIDNSLPLNLILPPGASGGPTTNGLNYVAYNTTYLDILRNKTSDVPIPPTTPSSPNASGKTSTSVTWTWQDNSNNETSFEVYAGVAANTSVDTFGNEFPAIPGTLIGSVSAGTTSFIQSGLTPNTFYSMQVIAMNGVSPSLRTSLYNSCTLAAAPSAGNNITCDRAVSTPYPLGTSLTFTNPAGFGVSGPYSTSSFRYAWDSNPTYTFTGSEPIWGSGSLSQVPVALGVYYLHIQSLNQEGAAIAVTLDYGPFVIPDTTPPVSSAAPTTGAYKAPLTITLSANETSTIYYTIDGSDPSTSSDVYAGPFDIGEEAILRFSAVDSAGNVETTINEEVYWMISSSDLIGEVRGMSSGTPVRLADKVLFWKNGTAGYIEESNRSSAIRVVSDPENPLTALPAVGTVCLAGTLNKTAADCYLSLDVVTPAGGAMDLKPLGASNAALKKSMLNAMYVKAYGKVQTGSITGDSFVIKDGSDTTGIKVMFTAGQVTVSEGQYVTILGAMGGTTTQPLLYLMSLTH